MSLVNCGLLVSLWIRSCHLGILPGPLFGTYSTTQIKQYHTIIIRFQVLFTPCYGFFSAFYHYTISLSVLKQYLRLEVNASWFQAQFPMSFTQELCTSSNFFPTGLSPCIAFFSKKIRLKVIRTKSRSYNTTSIGCFQPIFSLPSAVFSRWYLQHLNWFLFLRVLRRFNFPRLRLFLITRRYDTHSGTSRSKAACASLKIIAACHALHRVLSQAIHLMTSRIYTIFLCMVTKNMITLNP